MATKFALGGRLGKLIVRGGGLQADLAERLVSASVSMTVDEVTQMTLAFTEDETFAITESGLFVPGTDFRAGSRCDYADLPFEVRAVELAPRGGDHVLTVTCRSLGAGRLRRERGAKVRKNLSPTDFAKLEAKGAGLRFVGQKSAKRKVITRRGGDDAETTWDTLDRLAGECGFLVFEAAGTLYFGKPSWLVERGKSLKVTWAGPKTGDDLDALPTVRRSGDAKRRTVEVTAQMRGPLAEAARPGWRMDLAGIPTFEGGYLLTGSSFSLAENAPIELAAGTVIDPEKDKRDGGKGGKTASSGSGGSKSVERFVSVALAQAGDDYEYGAEADPGDDNPSAFDCSELVQWAAARAGVRFVDGSSAQIAACTPISVEQAIKTRGALLWHEGHIAISLGNGQTIEAANERVGVVSLAAAGRFAKGGLIPGLRYS